MRRIGMVATLLAAGCTPDAPAPENRAEPRATPGPAAPVATPSAAASPTGDLATWLAGAWSFDKECATDFSVHYNSDGSLQSIGNAGRWKAEGDTVTETITEHGEMGEDEATRVDPPEVRSYRVERIDSRHAVLRYQGRTIPLLRC